MIAITAVSKTTPPSTRTTAFYSMLYFRSPFAFPQSQETTMSRKQKVTLQTLNDNLQVILTRFDTLEGKADSLQRSFDRMSLDVARIPEIEQRLSTLETEVTLLRSRVDNLIGLYEKLDKRIERLEHEYLAITVALKRLEQHYDRLEADRLTERVQILEQKVAALEKGKPN